MKARKWIISLFVVMLAGAFTGSAFGDPPKEKCNSGNGNGSEPALADCDPGNSAGHNNGGD